MDISEGGRLVGVVGSSVERWLGWLVHDLSPLPLSLAINHCIKILALFGELMADGVHILVKEN